MRDHWDPWVEDIQTVPAVFTTREKAEAFIASHRYDRDGYHRWVIAEVPRDPAELSTVDICPCPPGRVERSVWAMKGHNWRDEYTDRLCEDCGFDDRPEPTP